MMSFSEASPHPVEMQVIIEGLVIGVGAGVTTAVILGVYRWVIRRSNRREQISYIRDIILDHRERIFSAVDIPPSANFKEGIAADFLRFIYFRDLESGLRVALSSRATALNYQEESSLRKVLADGERMMTDLTLSEKKVLPEPIADSFFESLQKLSWLGLPKRGSGS